MTNSECYRLIGVLFTSFPNSKLSQENADAYVSGIADLPFDAASKAIDRLRKTSDPFLPSIASIRRAAADVVLGPARSGEEAYGVLLEAIRRYGQYEAPKFKDPHLTRALGVWGGWVQVCLSPEDDPGGRARFIELYESLVRRERDDIVSGIPLPAPRGSEYALPEGKGPKNGRKPIR